MKKKRIQLTGTEGVQLIEVGNASCLNEYASVNISHYSGLVLQTENDSSDSEAHLLTWIGIIQ